VNERTAVFGNLRPIGRRAAANVESAQSAAKDPAIAPPPRLKRRGEEADLGIEVREEELGTVQAQQMYKMRCDCGRSWYELELRKLVQCPACHKPGLVSTSPPPRHASVRDGRSGGV
jgi:hypothetical protein